MEFRGETHEPLIRFSQRRHRDGDRHVHLFAAGTGRFCHRRGQQPASVKSDLISIASAERRYYATEGKYASLLELISTNSVSVARQRPPYSYTVDINPSGFRVVATRAGDSASGTPAQLSVDENMEFQTSE